MLTGLSVSTRLLVHTDVAEIYLSGEPIFSAFWSPYRSPARARALLLSIPLLWNILQDHNLTQCTSGNAGLVSFWARHTCHTVSSLVGENIQQCPF